MWYDATVAAGLLEAANSPVKGKNGFAFAPTDKTKSSGWLWSWALAIPKSSPDPTDAWKYISWATSAQYIKAAGTNTKGGWASIPPGTRLSTYRMPQYKAAAKAFAATTLAAMKAAPITNPARPSGRVYPVCNTSASRSSRTSATAARSSSRASSPAR